jgi:4-hydroxythreonine-4-phosphate dehydrogenase
MKRPVAISIGCPCGIGPEVAVVAAARSRTPCLLVGDRGVILRAAAGHGLSRRLVVVAEARRFDRLREGEVGVWSPSTALSRTPAPGRPGRAEGAAQLAWVDEATDLVTGGVAAALVTGPVSKVAIARSGADRRFRGHTEHIGARLGARETVMAFWSEKLSTSLVTTHLPLARVPRAITAEGVASSTFWLARLLADLGRERPRIVVAGLNPHAGEDGHLGTEEVRVVTPGVALARRRLARSRLAAVLTGPIGAESAYRLAQAGAFDGVVAMYHDQATIAMKLTGFGESVNVTLGLPIVRTSVDHGTAYDLVGTGRAAASGMCEAISLAARLAKHRDGRAPLRSAAITKRSRGTSEIR